MKWSILSRVIFVSVWDKLRDSWANNWHLRYYLDFKWPYSTSWQAVDMLNMNHIQSTCSMQNEQYMLMHAAIIKMIIGISMEMKWKCFDSMLSPYLSGLDFCNSLAWNIQFGELNFFPSLNWIFIGCAACKKPVWIGLKIQFIILDISNWRIAKIQIR